VLREEDYSSSPPHNKLAEVAFLGVQHCHQASSDNTKVAITERHPDIMQHIMMPYQNRYKFLDLGIMAELLNIV